MAGKTGKKSKFFRVATSGATTDGRVIDRVDIEQMAKNYDPKKYGVRVNLEHIRGLLPDSPFRMFGDVLALKAEEVEDGKLGLFAQIDPTDTLIDLVNVQRQKVYTSIEIQPNFADTGEAYLMGIAVTDSPASLGTEMLLFAAGAKVNPLADRKQHPGNLFTEAIAFTFELEDDSPNVLEGFSAKIKAIIGSFKKSSDANFNEVQQAVEVIAEAQKDLLEKFAAPGTNLVDVEDLKEQMAKLSSDHAALVQKLNLQPYTPPRERTPGGNAGAAVTDC